MFNRFEFHIQPHYSNENSNQQYYLVYISNIILNSILEFVYSIMYFQNKYTDFIEILLLIQYLYNGIHKTGIYCIQITRYTSLFRNTL